MAKLRIVGVDPDSKGCQFFLLAGDTQFEKNCRFGTDHDSLVKCVLWLKSLGEVLVGIEGRGNYSAPLENVLTQAGIRFLSLPADRLSDFRKAVIGQNKSNKNDARSAALYLQMLHKAGLTTNFETVNHLDSDLREITRTIYRKSKEVTFLRNRLYKIIRKASQDLYIWLSGGAEEKKDEARLDKLCVLRLLSKVPDISLWNSMSDEDFLAVMGSDGMKNRSVIVDSLRKSTAFAVPQKQHRQLLLKQTAADVLHLVLQIRELKVSLEDEAKSEPAVAALTSIKGIGTYLGASFVAEIGSIERFADNNKLASYAGFGRRSHSTGDKEMMLKSRKFNRYLKNTVMQVALRYVQWNPESILSGQYRAMVKNGMKKTEAYRRVGRALIRKFYAMLMGMEKQTSSERSGMEAVASRSSGNSQIDCLSNTLPSRTVTRVHNNVTVKKVKRQEKTLAFT